MELITSLLSLGVPIPITLWLMDNVSLLQSSAKWIVWLGQYVPVRFVRRVVSFLITIAVATSLILIGIWLKALPAPIGAGEWIDIVWEHSGLAIVLTQFGHAIRNQRH